MTTFRPPFADGSPEHVLLERIRFLHAQLNDAKHGSKEYRRLCDEVRDLGTKYGTLIDAKQGI
jgi:hypothetical protein